MGEHLHAFRHIACDITHGIMRMAPAYQALAQREGDLDDALVIAAYVSVLSEALRPMKVPEARDILRRREV